MILIVEDEIKIANLLEDYLRNSYEVKTLYTGQQVMPLIKEKTPELVLLDIMLPHVDGMTLCKEIKEFNKEIQIIMITARGEEEDRIKGLEIGADDYICKPFSPKEVVARVKARMRQAATIIQKFSPIEGLKIDDEKSLVWLDGFALDLTPVEYRLLLRLAKEPKQPISREVLMDHLYADHRIVSDRTVDSHVKNLRKKLSAIRPHHDLIHGVYGRGYKIDDTVGHSPDPLTEPSRL